MSQPNDRNQVRDFLMCYGLDNLNIHNNSLEGVFENTMWNDLVESFTHDRLFECAMTCGEKFTKVWDQGGSTR